MLFNSLVVFILDMIVGLSTDAKPVSGQSIGDMYFEKNTNTLFIFNNNKWIQLMPVTSGNIPTTVAYENQMNVFSSRQYFNSTVDIRLLSDLSIQTPVSGYIRLAVKQLASGSKNYGLYCRPGFGLGVTEIRII